MNILDWILIGIAAFSILRGLMRGFVSQMFGIAGILTGFYIAANNYEYVGAELGRVVPGLAGASPTVAFIFLFLLTWLCIAVAGFWTGRVLRRAGLGFLDRLWGGIVGFVKTLILAIATVAILTLFGFSDSPILTGSVLVPYIKGASGFLFKTAPRSVQNKFLQKQRDLERFLSQKTYLLPEKHSADSPAESKEKNERK